MAAAAESEYDAVGSRSEEVAAQKSEDVVTGSKSEGVAVRLKSEVAACSKSETFDVFCPRSLIQITILPRKSDVFCPRSLIQIMILPKKSDAFCIRRSLKSSSNPEKQSDRIANRRPDSKNDHCIFNRVFNQRQVAVLLLFFFKIGVHEPYRCEENDEL